MSVAIRSLSTVYSRFARAKSPRRFFCSTVTLCHDVPEVVHVKVGGSGHVALRVLNPLHRSDTEHNDVLVILPPGPNLRPVKITPEPQSSTSSLVCRIREALPSTTVVTVEYRLFFPQFRYPIPIHDAATAFAYISSPHAPHNQGRRPTVSLFGSHTGGSLALMLALTNPSLVNSVVSLEPLVDYVGIDELKPKAKDKEMADAKANLLTLRARLFATPSAYFDPFASPLLFLRAPGRDTPPTYSSPLTENKDDLFSEKSNDADAFGPYDDDMTSAIAYTPPKRRKVLRRWPPLGRSEEATLPRTTILSKQGSGLNEALRIQAKEMTEALQKACFWGREKGFAEDMVNMKISEEAEDNIDQVVTELVALKHQRVKQ